VLGPDLRANAGLVLAGLVASSETVINRVDHIDLWAFRMSLKYLCLSTV
jgi:UDP-N-acetylglucosamine enolpyruvyl transferase